MCQHLQKLQSARCVRHGVELHEAEAARLPRELVPNQAHLLHCHRMRHQAMQPVLPASMARMSPGAYW